MVNVWIFSYSGEKQGGFLPMLGANYFFIVRHSVLPALGAQSVMDVYIMNVTV